MADNLDAPLRPSEKPIIASGPVRVPTISYTGAPLPNLYKICYGHKAANVAYE